MSAVKVLAVLARLDGDICLPDLGEIAEARAAVAELIEAATRVNAEHTAPHDCYATGPMTGNHFLDLVSCPGCELSAALTRCGASA